MFDFLFLIILCVTLSSIFILGSYFHTFSYSITFPTLAYLFFYLYSCVMTGYIFILGTSLDLDQSRSCAFIDVLCYSFLDRVTNMNRFCRLENAVRRFLIFMFKILGKSSSFITNYYREMSTLFPSCLSIFIVRFLGPTSFVIFFRYL